MNIMRQFRKLLCCKRTWRLQNNISDRDAPIVNTSDELVNYTSFFVAQNFMILENGFIIFSLPTDKDSVPFNLNKNKKILMFFS